MKGQTIIRLILSVLFLFAGTAFGYNCGDCDDQCKSRNFGVDYINPLCRNACLTQQFQCYKVDLSPICNGAGGPALEAAQIVMAGNNAGLTRRAMDDAAKTILRPFFGNLVDEVTIIYGAQMLDKLVGNGIEVGIAAGAQTFGTSIYVAETWESLQTKNKLRITTLGHEMVHVQQYKRLGSVGNFGYEYFKGYCSTGDYYQIPLEIEAYDLERSISKSYDSKLSSLPKTFTVCNKGSGISSLKVAKHVIDETSLSLIPFDSVVGWYEIPANTCGTVHAKGEKETILGYYIYGDHSNGNRYAWTPKLGSDQNKCVDFNARSFIKNNGNIKTCVLTSTGAEFGGEWIVPFTSIEHASAVNKADLSERTYTVNINDPDPPTSLNFTRYLMDPVSKKAPNTYQAILNKIKVAFKKLHGFDLDQQSALMRKYFDESYYLTDFDAFIASSNTAKPNMDTTIYVQDVNVPVTINLPLTDLEGDIVTYTQASTSYYPETWADYLAFYQHYLPCADGTYDCIPVPQCGYYPEAPKCYYYFVNNFPPTNGALYGTMSLDAANRKVTFQPAKDGHISDGFSLQVTDATGRIEKVFITVRITPNVYTVQSAYTQVLSRQATVQEELAGLQELNRGVTVEQFRINLENRKNALYQQNVDLSQQYYNTYMNSVAAFRGYPTLAWTQVMDWARLNLNFVQGTAWTPPNFAKFVDAEKYAEKLTVFSRDYLSVPVSTRSCGSIKHGDKIQLVRYQKSTVAYTEQCISENQEAVCRDGEFTNFTGTFVNPSCSVMTPPADQAQFLYDSGATAGFGLNYSRTTNGSVVIEYSDPALLPKLIRFNLAQTPAGGGIAGYYFNASKAYVDLSSQKYLWFEARATSPIVANVYLVDINGAVQSQKMKLSLDNNFRLYSLDLNAIFGTTFNRTRVQALFVDVLSPLANASYSVDLRNIQTTVVARSCGTTASGQYATRVKYKTSTDPSTCLSETQKALCTNGVLGTWSGTFTYDSCRVLAKCGTTLSGQYSTRIRYKAGTDLIQCLSETQSALCTDGVLGTWNGTYTYASCSVTPAAKTLYDGEAVLFGLGTTWDTTGSTVAESTLSPYSGTKHIRFTLKNANYWGAGAYYFSKTGTVDVSKYNTLSLSLKSSQAVTAKVYFISGDLNKESQRVDLALTTAYKVFTLDLLGMQQTGFDRSKLKAIIVTTSLGTTVTIRIDADSILAK